MMNFTLPLALIAAVGSLGAGQSASAQPAPATETQPAIDRTMPAGIETATFALG
jgi:hypothetical protein